MDNRERAELIDLVLEDCQRQNITYKRQGALEFITRRIMLHKPAISPRTLPGEARHILRLLQLQQEKIINFA